MTDEEALALELSRLDLLIAAERQRLRARYELSFDEFQGLSITDERMDALLRGDLVEHRADPATASQIAAARATDAESR